MKKWLVAGALFVTCIFYPFAAISQVEQRAPFSLLIQYREVLPKSKASEHYSYQSNLSDLLEFEKTDAGEYGISDTKWSTLWTDGQSKKFRKGLIFASHEHLYVMIPVWATSGTGKTYAKILLTPILGGKSLTIWRDEVEDITASDPDRGGGPTTESIEILSVCGDWFSASIHRGNGIALHEGETWQTFRVVGSRAIAAHGLKIPADLVAKAEEKLNALPADTRAEQNAVTLAESCFAIAPHASGICAEFVDSRFPVIPALLYARVPVDHLQPFDSFISTAGLVKTRFGLDSSKYDLLTVSPDKSVVAYVKRGILYWQKGHEAGVSLGQLGEVRGFQWLVADADTLLSKPTR